MEKKGMHMFQITKKRLANRTAYALLLDDLEQAKYDLALAYSNFENAMEPDLIDCCIYQVNALQMRYKFLLTKAKQYDGDPYAKNPLELSEP